MSKGEKIVLTVTAEEKNDKIFFISPTHNVAKREQGEKPEKFINNKEEDGEQWARGKKAPIHQPHLDVYKKQISAIMTN